MNNLLQEANRIGKQIVSLQKFDKQGIFWISRQPGGGWGKTYNLYVGSCGIIYFLLTLYQITQEEEYLHTSIEAMRWAEWYSNSISTENYSLFCGKMSISYTFLKLFEVTHDDKYLQRALEVAKPCKIFLKTSVKCDLLTGTAGTLLSLLYLHAQTREEWVLETINDYIHHLIQKSTSTRIGLFWDEFNDQMRSLCGFSHGQSGIGFVFLELAHYFNNSMFYSIAKSAFAYENHFFNNKTKNWPDFRVRMLREKDRKIIETAYQQKKFELFTDPGNMNKWCHGAVGIVLSRLREYELLQDLKSKEDIQKSYDKVDHMYIHNSSSQISHQLPTLCHGTSGVGEFFLEHYNVFGKTRSLSCANTLAYEILQQKEKLGRYITTGVETDRNPNKEDVSLFNGLAGIGYYLLRVCYPNTIQSILSPKINIEYGTRKNLKKYPFIVKSYLLKKSVVSNIFPKTLQLAEKYAQKQIYNYFSYRDNSIMDTLSFTQKIKRILPTMPYKKRARLKDIFLFELQKMKITEESLISNKLFYNRSYIYIKNHFHSKTVPSLLDDKLCKFNTITLKLEPEFTFAHTKWNWDAIENIDKKPDYYPILIHYSSFGIETIPINSFCESVLKQFVSKKRVKDVIPDILSQYAITDTSTTDLKEKIVTQIKEALHAGILNTL